MRAPVPGGWPAGRRPGDRCKLYPRHVLLLALIRYYTGMAEGTMQPWFGVDQSGVSKYLDLAADILKRIVVSPKFLTGLLSMAESVDEITEPVSHLRLLVDGTHILRYRPGDKIRRKASYIGKKKQFTYNVQVITNCAGLILDVSGTVDGSIHDYALLKKHPTEAGAWLLELAETCSAEEKQMKMTSDLRYQRIEKDYLQFDHEQGTKRLRKDNPDYESKHGA